MQALIQILVVNDLKSGTSAKTGNKYEIQDAECVLLNDDGTPSQIGVLSIPKALRGAVKPGIYTGSFALRPDLQTRRIEAVLTGLVAAPIKSKTAVGAAAAA